MCLDTHNLSVNLDEQHVSLVFALAKLDLLHGSILQLGIFQDGEGENLLITSHIAIESDRSSRSSNERRPCDDVFG